MSEILPLLTVGLAFLVPVGYGLIAASGLPEERARQAALSILAALGLAALGYLASGFALQFGGVGLTYSLPGLEELIWEWSALGTTWGTGWGMAGLVGWGLTGPAATSGAYSLALANLPWVATAALIPLVSLRGRIPAWASGLLGLLMGAMVYPLAGNWIWGGGWLANLGANLGRGHGLVDPGGAGLVHVLGASAALAGILVFLRRKPRALHGGEPVPLPPVHLPLLGILGAGLLLVGGTAWTVANPLVDLEMLELPVLALNYLLAAAGGALLPLIYTWFVAGVPDPLMSTRGLAAGTVAIAAAGPFVPPWAALTIGCALGLLVPLVIFVVDHVLRWDDPTAALTVHGVGGAFGLLCVGVFADGRSGAGWNGTGVDSFLSVARQGVTGLLAAAGYRPDYPAQLQAQGAGLAALALFGFFAAWLAIAPLGLLVQLLQRPAPVARHPAPDAAVGEATMPPAPLNPNDTAGEPPSSSSVPEATPPDTETTEAVREKL